MRDHCDGPHHHSRCFSRRIDHPDVHYWFHRASIHIRRNVVNHDHKTRDTERTANATGAGAVNNYDRYNGTTVPDHRTVNNYDPYNGGAPNYHRTVDDHIDRGAPNYHRTPGPNYLVS